MKMLTIASLLLLSASASGGETPAPAPAAPSDVAAPEAAPGPATPPGGRKGDATDARPAAEQGTARAPSKDAPPPAVGWAGGERAPIYLGLMMMAEGYVEDRNYRLTTQDGRTLWGGGGLVRLGAVLSRHDRVGVRLQSFMRPTRKVITSTTAPDGTSEWGMVGFGYFGPEFLHTTDAGIYFGGSLGLAGVMSQSRLGCHHGYDYGGQCGLDRATGGGAVFVSLGYELRTSKWFALDAESFLGLYRGFDDDEKAMNGAVFGLGVGVGF